MTSFPLGELPDRAARGARGQPRRRHPDRLPGQDRPARAAPPHLGRRRRRRADLARLRRPAHLRPARPDLRGAGGDRRHPVDHRGRLRHLDGLLDGPPRPRPLRRAARQDRHRRRGGRISLVVVALLAVGREGLETALFLWSATQAADELGESTLVPFLGALLGILTAVAMGFAFYKGVLKINLAKFFKLHRHHPDHRRRRRAGVRRPRPPGGRHPARPEQPRLRRQRRRSRRRPGTARLLKGTVNFSPATTWLEAVAWVALRRPDDDPLPAADPHAQAHPPPPQSGSPRRRAPH